jgi:hypothetical protein
LDFAWHSSEFRRFFIFSKAGVEEPTALSINPALYFPKTWSKIENDNHSKAVGLMILKTAPMTSADEYLGKHDTLIFINLRNKRVPEQRPAFLLYIPQCK